MSDTATKYGEFLINKYFGDAASVVIHLMRVKGPCSLFEILKSCKNKLNPKRVSQLPLFCNLLFHFYGKVSEEIIFYLSLLGRAPLFQLLSTCLKEHFNNEKDNSKNEYIELLSKSVTTLIKTKVLQVVNPKSWMTNKVEDNLSTTFVQELNENQNKYVENISNDLLCEVLRDYVKSGYVTWPHDVESDEPLRKRLKSLEDNSEINRFLKLVVRPNIQTMETMWRDRLICQFASEYLDEHCGDILSHLLCIATAACRSTGITSTESGSVSQSEVMRSMRHMSDYFSSYISLLTDSEVPFLLQQPGLSGHMYSCPYKQVVKHLLIKHVEYVVQILFKSSGLRIFRLLITSGPLSIEEIERKVLLAQNDFRTLLPRMVTIGLIFTTELSRTKDFSAETIYCLYSVKLEHISRFMIELAQHSLLRIGLKQHNIFNQKKRLIDQRYRVEILICQQRNKLNETELSNERVLDKCSSEKKSSHVDAEDIVKNELKESVQALKSSITPGELDQLSNLTGQLFKLFGCEMECHVAWFVSDLYLRLHS